MSLTWYLDWLPIRYCIYHDRTQQSWNDVRPDVDVYIEEGTVNYSTTTIRAAGSIFPVNAIGGGFGSESAGGLAT